MDIYVKVSLISIISLCVTGFLSSSCHMHWFNHIAASNTATDDVKIRSHLTLWPWPLWPLTFDLLNLESRDVMPLGWSTPLPSLRWVWPYSSRVKAGYESGRPTPFPNSWICPCTVILSFCIKYSVVTYFVPSVTMSELRSSDMRHIR